MYMASSITCPISTAAVKSSLRRIPITPNRICSSARISTGGGRLSATLGRAAPPPSFEEGGNGTYKHESEPANPDQVVVGSSQGWLAIFNQRDCNLFLWNPITSQTIQLPPLQTLPISRENLSVSKVTLSCPPDHGECLAVMAFGGGRKLARCRPGRSTNWTPFGGLRDADQGRLYPDFVYSTKHKLFFCLAQFDGVEGFDVEIWDLHDDSAIRSSVGIKPNLYEKQKHEIPREHLRRYLVYAEHSDELFIVTRLLGNENNSGKTVGFDVHSVGFFDDKMGARFMNGGMEKKKQLGYMEESLDGLVMCVGVNDSFAVSAEEYPQLKPDSIYFNAGDDDIGIFDYQNKTISSSRDPVAPFWFTPYNSQPT